MDEAGGDDAVRQRGKEEVMGTSGVLQWATTFTFGKATQTMTLRSDRRDLSYSEITDLALSMPDSEKLKLAERLKEAGVKADWEAIFRAFRAPKLDQRTINKAVKAVRARRNGTKKRTATSTGR